MTLNRLDTIPTTYVSCSQAAALMNVSERTLRRQVLSGILPAEEIERGVGQGGVAYRVPLAALPAEAQIRYWEELGRAEDRAEGRTEGFDLGAYKARYGDEGIKKLLNRQTAVLRLRGLRRGASGDLTSGIEALAQEFGMSGATLRRLETRYNAEGLAGLARRGRDDKGESRSMCLEARRLICEMDLDWRKLAANVILDAVLDRARELGARGCENCPYNHDMADEIEAMCGQRLSTSAIGRHAQRYMRDKKKVDIVLERMRIMAEYSRDHALPDVSRFINALIQDGLMRRILDGGEEFDEMDFRDVLKYSIQAQRAAVYEYRYKDNSCVREEIDGEAEAEARMTWLRGLMRDRPELMAEIERSYNEAAASKAPQPPMEETRADAHSGDSGDREEACGDDLGAAGGDRGGTAACTADP